ncbi:MAG: hypothetical protein AAGD06_30455 [Acidobacteriota bacterium]
MSRPHLPTRKISRTAGLSGHPAGHAVTYTDDGSGHLVATTLDAGGSLIDGVTLFDAAPGETNTIAEAGDVEVVVSSYQLQPGGIRPGDRLRVEDDGSFGLVSETTAFGGYVVAKALEAVPAARLDVGPVRTTVRLIEGGPFLNGSGGG